MRARARESGTARKVAALGVLVATGAAIVVFVSSGGRTCTNGDRSAYFWPVVRIDQNVRAEQADTNAALADTVATVSCPNVADRLPAVPGSAAGRVRSLLTRLDQMTAAANTRLAAGKGKINAGLNNAVLDSLRTQRTATIKQISRPGSSPSRNCGSPSRTTSRTKSRRRASSRWTRSRRRTTTRSPTTTTSSTSTRLGR